MPIARAWPFSAAAVKYSSAVEWSPPALAVRAVVHSGPERVGLSRLRLPCLHARGLLPVVRRGLLRLVVVAVFTRERFRLPALILRHSARDVRKDMALAIFGGDARGLLLHPFRESGMQRRLQHPE
jgi:hypothetical protein